jgi:ribosome-binding factor A
MSVVTRKPERDMQIASLIEEELRLILASAADPRINQLEIRSVIPKPGGRHFSILFGPPSADEWAVKEDEGGLEAGRRLDAAMGFLKSELAMNLGLKRCPEISFHPDPLVWSTIAGTREQEIKRGKEPGLDLNHERSIHIPEFGLTQDQPTPSASTHAPRMKPKQKGRKSKATALTLIAMDTEGKWNIPLLQNAAQAFGAELVFARDVLEAGKTAMPENSVRELKGGLLEDFDNVIACETGLTSRSLYDFALPPGKTALIVGNEQKGIRRRICKKADHVVSIPMRGRNMTSINVATAAAVTLYAFYNDLGRKKISATGVSQARSDLLIQGSDDPSELGSLLRSVWAFGWKRVFLLDSENVWFNTNRQAKLAGRAAARREKNPLAVLPGEKIKMESYDRVIHCVDDAAGTELSRYVLPVCKRPLIVLGADPFDTPEHIPRDQVYVDSQGQESSMNFRSHGTISLSLLSQMLKQGKHG